MDDPFASIIPLCHISSSQRDLLSLSPHSDANDSQQSETPGCFPVESTQIYMESPPESPEAKGDATSDDKFETPPEVALPAASSEEQWFGCDGGTATVSVENEKTVDLGRDSDLGFSEAGVTQKVVANSESGGSKVVHVAMSESELGEYRAWKRKLASAKRLLDERPLKQLVSGNDSNLSKSMGDLKSSSSITGFESPSNEGTEAVSMDSGLVSDAEIAKNCLELNDCTEAVSADSKCKGLVSEAAKNCLELNGCTEPVRVESKGKGLVSDPELDENCLELNGCTEAVSAESEGKGLVSDAEIAKNCLELNTEPVRVDSEGNADMAENCLGLNDCTETVRVDSEGKGLVSDTEMDENCLELNGCTEHVRDSDSEGKGLVSDAEMAENCLELNDCTETVRVDSEGKGLVSDDAIVKNDLESNDSTEEVVVLDSKESHLVSDVVVAKNGFASSDSTEVVVSDSEDEGLILGVGIAKDGQVLNDGPENGVDDGSNVGRAEELQHHGERVGGEKNIEDIDKFRYAAPSGSDSTERPKVARVLPMSMHAAEKEADSGENHNMDLFMSVLRMLPKKDPDPRFENLSFLEIAKLRGITFPRPRWWGEEEEKEEW